MIKFSELREGALLNHNGEVMMKHQVKEMILNGEQTHPIYTVTENFIQSALKIAWRDSVEGIEGNDEFTMQDNGELVEIDQL